MKVNFRLSTALCSGLLAVMICSTSAKAFALKDACTLITAADAQAALGEPVGPAKSEPRSMNGGDGSECKFRSTIGSPFKAKSVSLTVEYSQTDLTGSNTGIADNLRSSGFQNVRQVPGIGSSAVWGTMSMMGKSRGELTVIKGKSVMLIILISGIPDDATALQRATSLAAKAIPLT